LFFSQFESKEFEGFKSKQDIMLQGVKEILDKYKILYFRLLY